MRKLLWVLVVLVVLLLGVDRAGDYVAERTVAQELQSSQDLRRTPEVDITGFPFLTQVARQRFDLVHVTTRDLRVTSQDRTLRLSSVAFDLREVTTDRRFTRFRAATGNAHARLSYAELSRLVGLDVSYAGSGEVKAGKQLTVAGQRLRPSLTVRPRLVDGALTFSGGSGGGLPSPVVDTLRRALGLEVRLEGLPFDVRATSLRADRQGLVLGLAGRDLTYAR